MFDVTLKSAGNGKPAGEVLDTFRVGAVVQATGWRPREPRDTLPYGKVEDVIRNVDLEEMVKQQGRITRPCRPSSPIPPRESGPQPRRRRMRTVSAWSSWLWAVAIARAPDSSAISARAAKRSERAASCRVGLSRLQVPSRS